MTSIDEASNIARPGDGGSATAHHHRSDASRHVDQGV